MYIIDNQYFPSINYYYTLLKNLNIEIVEYEVFKKSTFRNRCIITGSSGMISLSIPLKHGRNQKAFYRDVEICYQEDWQKRHWRSILACYNRSAFFDHYQSVLQDIFSLKMKFLFDFNWYIQEKMASILRISLPACCKTEPTPDEVQGDFRDIYSPQNFKQFHALGEYIQVFETKHDFIPNLSIVDLLCNLGPDAMNYLREKMK
ncbi:MAG: WbqC family protein [Bacteroidetes bacterium]|nr:WbqC family protein [Bacteroidota bacterium]